MASPVMWPVIFPHMNGVMLYKSLTTYDVNSHVHTYMALYHIASLRYALGKLSSGVCLMYIQQLNHTYPSLLGAN